MRKVLLVMLVLVFLVGCQNDTPNVDDTLATLEGVEKIVYANNQFAFDLYNEVNSDENVFFSPYSITTALAMTYEGARGTTAEEMQSVFRFPEDDIERRSSYASLFNEINSGSKDYKLHTANSLWGQKDYPFLQDYLDVVKNYYGGEINSLDFASDPDGSTKIINDWVEEKTNGKIKDIIDGLDPLTRLVLANAIYFKGEWVKQFDKSKTKDDNFYITNDEIVQVPMMQLTGEEAEFKYAENNDLQLLEMPYEGDKLSMLILLPKDDLNDIEKILSADQLNEWKSLMYKQRVDVYMPKFTFESKYYLANNLINMGMPTAFGSNADFSGMDGTDMLFIGKVIHQAFVDVNEEGTEAAAATVVVMELKAALPEEPVIFRADHPFIFIIQDKDNGNILFLGKVVNPS